MQSICKYAAFGKEQSTPQLHALPTHCSEHLMVLARGGTERLRANTAAVRSHSGSPMWLVWSRPRFQREQSDKAIVSGTQSLNEGGKGVRKRSPKPSQSLAPAGAS